MTGLKIGYARGSTDGQDLTAQRDGLQALGVPADRLYVDHGLTGTNRDRPGLRQALAACRARDTLVVTKLDRLARSLPDARGYADTCRCLRRCVIQALTEPESAFLRPRLPYEPEVLNLAPVSFGFSDSSRGSVGDEVLGFKVLLEAEDDDAQQQVVPRARAVQGCFEQEYLAHSGPVAAQGGASLEHGWCQRP